MTDRRDQAGQRRFPMTADSGRKAWNPSPGGLHAALSRLGDRDQAFELLELAYQQHDVVLPVIAVDPQRDSLRSNPRFDDLVRRMGLAVP